MLINRIGTFLIIVGATFIGMFILSDLADAMVCGFFWYGLIFISIGFLLWARGPRANPQPNGRFRVLNRAEKKQEKKLDKK